MYNVRFGLYKCWQHWLWGWPEGSVARGKNEGHVRHAPLASPPSGSLALGAPRWRVSFCRSSAFLCFLVPQRSNAALNAKHVDWRWSSSPTDFFVKYRCGHCQDEIVGVRIRCAVCVDFELCLLVRGQPQVLQRVHPLVVVATVTAESANFEHNSPHRPGDSVWLNLQVMRPWCYLPAMSFSKQGSTTSH